MASYGVKGAPIAMSAKEWRLHCQIPHTETSSYLRTSRATFIFDALRRTGWAGGFEPLHLEIRSAELHPASTGSRRRSGAPVRVPPPRLRVLANSDSISRGSNPAAPTSQSVSNASHMQVAQNRAVPHGFVDVSWSPCADLAMEAPFLPPV